MLKKIFVFIFIFFVFNINFCFAVEADLSNMRYSPYIGISSVVSEHYEECTTTPDYIDVHYIYSPHIPLYFLLYIIGLVVVIVYTLLMHHWRMKKMLKYNYKYKKKL